MHKSVVVQYLKDGHSSSFRPPLYSPYPSTGHSSVGRVVRPYEPPALLTCLRLTRAFSLSTSRACHKVHVEDGSHRVDISPTSGSLTLHGDGSGFQIPALAQSACASPTYVQGGLAGMDIRPTAAHSVENVGGAVYAVYDGRLPVRTFVLPGADPIYK